METITITLCECGENHAGMQQIGKKAEHGYSLEDLLGVKTIIEDMGGNCELFRINDLLPVEVTAEEAHILVIRNGINIILNNSNGSKELYDEQKQFQPDKKAYMYGRVCNKHARYNLVFADFDQEPDYENKKGTIINFNLAPHLNYIRHWFSQNINKDEVLAVGEGNYYYDISKTYIG